MIIEFISQYWSSLVVVAVVLAYLIYLTITEQWTKLREFAYRVMLLAERTFSENDGEIKFDFVIRVVYKKIPIILKPFISEADLKSLVQQWYEIAKDFLDDGVINSSIRK